MGPKRILCPVDFSECSQAALKHACEAAARHDAKLYIVHVEAAGHSVPPGKPGYVAELDGHRRLLNEANPCSQDVDYEQHYLRGNVVDEIRNFATLRDIDLIVVGTHGRTGLSRALMGSVAESLSKHAPCEVTSISITHQPADSPDTN
jgi:nucleotide-binding universal stress UspA family protein